MKQTLLGAIGGLAAGAGLMWVVLTRHEPAASHAEHDEKKGSEKAEAHSPDEVKMDRDRQSRAGLETAVIKAAEWSPSIFGYGRVLDPAPLVTALVDIDTAQATLSMSEKEHVRTKALFAQNQNASLASVEIAEAAFKRDQLLLESARLRLLSVAGTKLAERADIADLGRSMAALQVGLVRIELLPGQSWAPPGVVRLAPVSNAGTLVEAEWVGSAPSVDPVSQGLGFLLLMRTNFPAPGTAMMGQFASANVAEKGFRVPDVAVVRHLGAMWFYAQTGDEEFERRLLRSGRRLDDGWFLAEGIAATDRVVVQGAQVLLSEQLKGAGGEE